MKYKMNQCLVSVIKQQQIYCGNVLKCRKQRVLFVYR